MKRWIAAALALIMLLSLCACGKSEAVKNVETLIKGIGEVTLEKEALIREAEEAYELLTESEKGKVKNYDDLQKARRVFEELVDEQIGLTEELIANIGEVTADSELAILAAEAAYEQLPEAARSRVSNRDVLFEAKERFECISLLEEARQRGEYALAIGEKYYAYFPDEDKWFAIEEPPRGGSSGLTYKSVSITWNVSDWGKINLSTETPSAWTIKDFTTGYKAGRLYFKNNSALWYWSAGIDNFLKDDPYDTLDAAFDAIIGSSKHSDYHHTVFAGLPAIWCTVTTTDGQEVFNCLIKVQNRAVSLWAFETSGSVTQTTLNVALHSLEKLSISVNRS